MDEHTGASVADADNIRAIERARLRALVEGDMELAHRLHGDDFELITPIGICLSKEQYLGAIRSGHMKYMAWEPGPIEVRLHGGVAIIRYQAQLEIVFGGHHVPARRYWHTDSYEQRNGEWQVVWSQATEIK